MSCKKYENHIKTKFSNLLLKYSIVISKYQLLTIFETKLSQESIVDCLRKRKVDDILKVELKTPDYLTAFGPIIDSIVVPSDPRKPQWVSSGRTAAKDKLKQSTTSVGDQYDLMFGVNQIESPCIFGASEERMGIDGQRRDRLLRTLVRNLFDFHQQVINGRHFTDILGIGNDKNSPGVF